MPLTDHIMHASVRIIGGEPSKRGAIGTGFSVVVPGDTDPDVLFGYLLTAHHVIEGEAHIEVEIPDHLTDGSLYPRVTVTDWRRPIYDLDLVVAPFARPKGYNVSALELGQHLVPGLEVPLGALFHYVGLLAPLDRPMARSGTIGARHQAGLSLGPYSYAAYLVDCRSYGGFSGSPCYAEFPFARLTPTEPPIPVPEGTGPMGGISYLHLLMGMFTAHISDERAPDWDGAVSRYGVGVVLPSDYIWQALMTDEMQATRRS